MSLVPMILENTPKGERAMDLFSRMLDDNIVFLNGAVTQASGSLIMAQLLWLNSKDKDKPIFFYINSEGGSISSAYQIYDTMNYISNPVYTICTGIAMSAGAFLLGAGEKGHRYSLPNSEMLIHQPLVSGGISGQETDVIIHAQHLTRTRARLEAVMAEYTGQSVETIHNACDRDNYLTPEEAKTFGLIDKIITSQNDLL
jgi:ATP-dependent Clp protease protease subunit